MPDCLTPMPARFGEVPGELLLDFGGLFRVYRVGYKATPPVEPVAAHLAKAGVAALVLFTKDQKDFQLLYQDQERRLARADAQGVENLLGRLCELQRQGKDPLEAAQWVKDILRAQAEQEGLFRKRPYRNQGLFSEHYLEVRLRETPEWSEDPEAFRFFWLFFRREAFLEGPQGSFLRRVLEASEQYGLRVGERLKEVVFEEVFPLLAEGFLRYHTEVRREAVDEVVLRETYRATMVLLYRLLFLLYAEDRNLLPVHDVLGYRALSLTQLRREVAEGMDKGRVYIEGSQVMG